jgi:formylglycine-generating enzyme required for sulfatase activity
VPGTDVLFSIWETRIQDYEAFARENPQADESWKNPGFDQGKNHPVVNVSWLDAQAFCAWLTKKERAEGKIGKEDAYRLPTDAQWSVAVGSGKYPWGNEWPPPKNAWNYDPSLEVDSYDFTSPVGSFPANRHGLYDMGGNVRQWCEDWYRASMNESVVLEKLPFLKDDGGGQTFRVVRGASWRNFNPENLLSSFRLKVSPVSRGSNNGFRCVLVVGSSR